jgi:hypothetical protein
MARTAQATEATESDKERTRRARKRITDRKSQQQHRQRQRAYVRELEETVQAYKQSCAQNGSVDVATLLSENEQLRKRCQNLESLLAKINNLSSGHGIIHFQATASSPDSTEQTASPETKSTQATSAHDHDHEPHSNASQEGQDHHFSGLPGITQGPATASASTSPNPLSNMSLPLFGEDTGESATSVASGLRYPNTVSDNLFARAPSVDVDDPAAPAGTREDENDAQLYPLQHELESQEGASIEAMDRFLASIVDGTAISLDIVPMSLTTRDPLLSRLCGPQASVTDEALTYMVYPTTTAPSCQWDNFMQRVINEAKAQHSLGQFPTSAPTLRAVLSRQSSDVLASRLYHWLSSYLPMPLHMFLAIFWVQYLFLRVC